MIELWETYLLQLDSDEDGPPLMPAGVKLEAEAQAQAQAQLNPVKTRQPDDNEEESDERAEQASVRSANVAAAVAAASIMPEGFAGEDDETTADSNQSTAEN